MDRMASDSAQHSCVQILHRYFAEFNLHAIRKHSATICYVKPRSSPSNCPWCHCAVGALICSSNPSRISFTSTFRTVLPPLMTSAATLSWTKNPKTLGATNGIHNFELLHLLQILSNSMKIHGMFCQILLQNPRTLPLPPKWRGPPSWSQ